MTAFLHDYHFGFTFFCNLEALILFGTIVKSQDQTVLKLDLQQPIIRNGNYSLLHSIVVGMTGWTSYPFRSNFRLGFHRKTRLHRPAPKLSFPNGNGTVRRSDRNIFAEVLTQQF